MLSELLSTTFATANVSKDSLEILRLDAVSHLHLIDLLCILCIQLYFVCISVPIPKPIPPPTDFPRPDIVVNCLADGVQTFVNVVDPNFHGVMYVKGHSNDPNCRRSVEQGEAAEPLDFTVKFDTCGLFHSDVWFKDCMTYPTKERESTKGVWQNYFLILNNFFLLTIQFATFFTYLLPIYIVLFFFSASCRQQRAVTFLCLYYLGCFSWDPYFLP